VGHPLQRELAGLWSARRGAYRIVYELNEAELMVNVIRIDHRADVYRPR
jgi:mRNA-degrading endonuclease RelE of RelBE toxin-antitoxin system